jgi:hypothetical protein
MRKGLLLISLALGESSPKASGQHGSDMERDTAKKKTKFAVRYDFDLAVSVMGRNFTCTTFPSAVEQTGCGDFNRMARADPSRRPQHAKLGLSEDRPLKTETED